MIKRVKKTLINLTGKVGRRLKRRPPKIEKAAQHNSAAKTGDKSKVLMFGWELPPFNSGGLGVACYELAQSLAGKDTSVTFVLPKKVDVKVPFMKVAFAKESKKSKSRGRNSIKYKQIDSNLSPYLTSESYLEQISIGAQGKGKFSGNYSPDLIGEVYRYGESAAQIASEEDFKVIHAHDWLSYPAGMKAKKVSGKPLITHVHAIEYDRSHEGGVNPAICRIEKAGLEAADKVIAVSNFTKQRIHQYYGIPLEKIEVVHNGINLSKKPVKKISLKSIKSGGKKMALFVGRITYQKGVDYFIDAARKAVKIDNKLIFMVVGSGDMMYQIIDQAAHYGISDRVFFPGFLRGADLENIYQAADVYVMPSVSEPFGLVALEALSNKVPVIVSKQSGASEVLRHSLKVDFWDTDELANKIVAVVNNPSLKQSLSKNGHKEVQECTWDKAADKCIKIYQQLAVS